MKKVYLFMIALFFISALAVFAATGDSFNAETVALSDEEKELFDSINAYRAEKKLPPIPFSASLTFVAQTHVKDLFENRPDKSPCNMHSWSNKGKWTPCCYTPDHKQAKNMWNKPSELTGYKGAGYEISTMISSGSMTAKDALRSWKSSSGHNAVIVNESIWKAKKWTSLGVGMYKNYAVVWFSDGSE
jgi:uncharacterized protein YkwD